MRSVRRAAAVVALSGLALLVLAPSAFAHARMSPAVSLAGKLQLYSLAIPTEKEGLTTTKIVLTVPSGFGIDSFVPAPGWTRQVQSTGSGDSAVVQTVTWTGGSTPTGEDSLFQFLAQPAHTGTYTFQVKQTYSDGSIVDWTGSESVRGPGADDRGRVARWAAAAHRPLTIVGLVVAVLALILAGVALFVARRQGRAGAGMRSRRRGSGQSAGRPRVALLLTRRPRRRTRTWSRPCRRQVRSWTPRRPPSS